MRGRRQTLRAENQTPQEVDAGADKADARLKQFDNQFLGAGKRVMELDDIGNGESAAKSRDLGDHLRRMTDSLNALKAHHGVTDEPAVEEAPMIEEEEAVAAPTTRKASRVQNYMTARKKVRGAMKEEAKGK